MSLKADRLDQGLSVSGAKRAVIASSFGNMLENYDNVIYAYMAVWISQLFFPADGGGIGLLATFATFAVGFLARPVGTLVFGHLGDRAGRKTALVVSVALMGVSTVALGLLPTFETAGILAPILLVICRLVQGFSVAGEFAGSATMLVEYAPKQKRGLYGSFNQVSTALGFLLGSLTAAAVNLIFNDQQMLEWAWRIPFWAGALTAVVAIYLRFGLEDTPQFLDEKEQGTVVKNPLGTALKTQFPAIIKGFCFTIFWTTGYFYFLTYIPTHLTAQVGLEAGAAQIATAVSLIAFTLMIIPFAVLSDRIGRKRLLLTSTGGFALVSLPVLALMGTGSMIAIYTSLLVVAIFLAMLSGPGIAALTELFPTNVRYSALGIGYNFSVMIFGGTAAFIAQGIIQVTGNPVMTALLPAGAAIISFVTILFMKDRYKEELK